MSNPKERHYWAQLRSSLTAGQWRSPAPAKAPNGTLLPWSELFRKFNKHCRGFNDVADVAEMTRVLASFLAKDRAEDEDVVGNGVMLPVDLGEECLLDDERELIANYERLKSSPESNSVNFALAYYAYALHKPQECLDYLARVPDILMIQNHIPSSPYNGAQQQTSSASHISVPFDSSLPEIRDGRAWAMTEAFRGICLQGLAQEKLDPTNPLTALHTYSSSLPLFSILSSEFTHPSFTQSTGKLDFTAFYQLREMWRWVERLLWRAVVLSGKVSEVHHDGVDSLWQWLPLYLQSSSSWPASFRTAHRSTITCIFLRAFVLRYRMLSESPTPPPTIDFTAQTSSKANWLHQARTLCQDYRAILSSCTQFPRAGEKNKRVEEFVDAVVSIWEAGGGAGEAVGWVVELLWWATRYTFNSPRIYRHMTRLFHLSGDTPLAIRTLKLYIQIVGKAYQTRKAEGKVGASTSAGEGDGEESDEHWVETCIFGIRMICRHYASLTSPHFDEEVDDTEMEELLNYAGTLIGKARARLLDDVKWKLLNACLYLAEGVWECCMAQREEDPYTRPHRFQSAHRCFLVSVQTQPTSSGYFHLALSFARSLPCYDSMSASTSAGHPSANATSGREGWRDLDKAVESAGLGLESDPKELRYWHLLGLLLSAKEKWEDAREILERGVGVDDDSVRGEEREEDGTSEEEEEEEEEEAEEGGEHETRGTSVKANVLPAYTTAFVLSDTDPAVPPASELIRSMLEKSPPTKREIYEYSLQLRMTLVKVVEVIEGPEGAERMWVDVFRWIAERRGVGQGQGSEQSHRVSMDSMLPPSMMDKTFVTRNTLMETQVPISPTTINTAANASTHVNSDPNMEGQRHEVTSPSPPVIHEPQPRQPTQLGAPTPIPITISPATPTTAEGFHDAQADPLIDEVLSEKSKTNGGGLRVKRSSLSIDRGDTTKSNGNKKVQQVQQMLKDRVHKGRQGITAVSRKIGHGVVRGHHRRFGQHHGPGRGMGMLLRRTNSSPDFHEVIRNASYQASSIHSRRRLGSFLQLELNDQTPPSSPPPPPPLPQTLPTSQQQASSSEQQVAKSSSKRQARENRLLSQLWLMSAATFRRLGKIEQAKAAIQEAEVKDEGNPGVWVQLGLYYFALGHGHRQHAIDALQKALMIDVEDVEATVHLGRVYLSFEPSKKVEQLQQQQQQQQAADPATPDNVNIPVSSSPTSNRFPPPPPQAQAPLQYIDDSDPDRNNIDLAAGLLAHITRGKGWDVPEAWYFLAKAYGMQGRKGKEVEALKVALELAEGRGVREVGSAVGVCI